MASSGKEVEGIRIMRGGLERRLQGNDFMVRVILVGTGGYSLPKWRELFSECERTHTLEN
jgi:hypothetical protein